MKGFPSPGCFEAGGNDDSETAASRAAQRIANQQNAQARADWEALVDAYHEAVTGTADPVAATQDGAVAAGDAVDPPHPGRCRIS